MKRSASLRKRSRASFVGGVKGEDKIWVLNRQRKFKFNLPKIRRISGLILEEFGKEKEVLSLLFVNDRAMRKINRDFRQMDSPTDVLSFPMSNNVATHPFIEGGGERGPEMRLLGDIVFSVESAQKQAKSLGHSLERELIFLLTHGILHLLGWDHERSPQEAKKMYQKQRDILAKLSLVRSKR